ncbi:hypothetical protein SNE510_58290 [Streptomyces sp. NE5-10]|uniref:toxin Doc n=1 Tax=Streptomyces sp. NE5-10 TaxID=2759674 RepID=UPI00190836AE|nr:toxin Doc [Streptomyces sp. NE5-10]GHJ96310.1 hypothetical protein SNE510_58290 [Streptomyces sp. NE5-10]
MELRVDLRWLLDRQEDLLGKELAVRDYSGLMAAVARHKVDSPRIDVAEPDAYWRAAALLDTLVLLRPLAARNAFFAYGVTVAYIRASGKTVDDGFESWGTLIRDIHGLRLSVYDIADRLRSMQPGI